MAVLTGLPVAMAFKNVFTVVTGLSDTMHYFASARDILAASSQAEWLQAVFQWAPGWPLVVAAFIRFGDSSYVYFLPPVLIWATIFTIGCFAWVLTRRFAVGLLVALTASHFLLFGHTQSPYNLLYPFREPLSFLGLSLGWLTVALACRARGAHRRTLLFLSGLATVLAAAVREPAVFSLAGVAGYVLVAPGSTFRSRAADGAAVLAPLLLAFAVLAGYFVMTGRVGTDQFTGWQTMTASRTWGEWRGMCFQYAWILSNMLGLSGMLFLGLGVAVTAWKYRSVALLLLVPALATLAFYATFAVYPRYALSVALYLVPLVGAGCAVTGEAALRLLCCCRSVGFSPVCALLGLVPLTLSLRQASQLTPWGQTTIRDLRQLATLLNGHLKPGDRIVIDFRHRPLHDLLVSHLGIFPEGADIQPHNLENRRRIFFEPQSEAGETHAKVLTPPVHMREVITRWQDNLPLIDQDGRPVTMTLGDATYALRELRPWSAKRIEETVFPGDVLGGLLWFDFRAANTLSERRLRWRNVDGEILRTGALPAGSDMMACAAGSMFDGRAAVRVEIESEDPMPARIIVRGDARTEAAGFGYGTGRRLSTQEWVAVPVIRSDDKWGAVFVDEAAFRIPNPVDADQQVLSVVFTYQVRFPAPGKARFRYADASGELEEISSALDGPILHTVRIPPQRRGAPVLSLRLNVETPKPFANHFRLISIRMGLE